MPAQRCKPSDKLCHLTYTYVALVNQSVRTISTRRGLLDMRSSCSLRFEHVPTRRRIAHDCTSGRLAQMNGQLRMRLTCSTERSAM